MNLRKFFNILSDEEKKIIEDQCLELEKMADKMSNDDYKNECIYENKHNLKCPNCHGLEVVNKIADIHGSGYISGSFNLGYGDVYGESEVNTTSVNHCNNCGNQWKKYERKYNSMGQIIGNWINYIMNVFEKKFNEDRFYSKQIEFLNDYYAESIWQLYQKHEYYTYSSTQENISLKLLRIKYKSIYDK